VVSIVIRKTFKAKNELGDAAAGRTPKHNPERRKPEGQFQIGSVAAHLGETAEREKDGIRSQVGELPKNM